MIPQHNVQVNYIRSHTPNFRQFTNMRKFYEQLNWVIISHTFKPKGLL